MERLRRIVLVLGITGAVWCFFYADLAPLVIVSPETRAPRGVDEIVAVSGEAWNSFLAGVDDAAAGRGPEAWRCGPEQEDYRISRRLFYRPDEGPLAEFAARLPRPWGVVRLEHDQRIYDLQRVTIEHDDFQFGTGYASLAPPDRFFRPWRRLAPFFLACAFLAYVFLPWPKRATGDLAYDRWRVVLSDLLGLMLFGVFFVMPFFIIGGSVQAIVVGWPLLIGMWFLAALGLLALAVAGWSSAFAIRLGTDNIAIRSFTDWEIHPFAEMEYFGPAIRRSPGWFRALLMLAALSGRSGGGAAALAATSECGGLAIGLRDGRTLLVWICTPLGAPTIAGADRIPKALRAALVAETEEPTTYVGFGRAHLVANDRLTRPTAIRA